MEGEWKQHRGKATYHWGKMMKDDLAETAGKYEELVGRLQQKFGIVVEQSKHGAEEFKKVVGQLRKSNARLMKLQAHQKNAKQAPGKTKSMTSAKPTPRSQIRG
jgi:uncharacterized protein YjbJ (UPF0337 family)